MCGVMAPYTGSWDGHSEVVQQQAPKAWGGLAGTQTCAVVIQMICHKLPVRLWLILVVTGERYRGRACLCSMSGRKDIPVSCA